MKEVLGVQRAALQSADRGRVPGQLLPSRILNLEARSPVDTSDAAVAALERLIDERVEQRLAVALADASLWQQQEGLSTKQAAALLGISPAGVVMRLKRGTLDGHKVGRRWVVSAASVRRG